MQDRRAWTKLGYYCTFVAALYLVTGHGGSGATYAFAFCAVPAFAIAAWEEGGAAAGGFFRSLAPRAGLMFALTILAVVLAAAPLSRTLHPVFSALAVMISPAPPGSR